MDDNTPPREIKGGKQAFYSDPGRRPVAPRVNPDGIPLELKAIPNWVGWRFEWREGRGIPKWDKPPYTPGGPKAKSNDSSTWAAFDTAWSAYLAGQYDGIGFQLGGSGVVGIDLDDVIDSTTGRVLVPWVADLINRADTFADLSPSDTGVKIFGFGEWAGDWNRRKHPNGFCEIEVYTTQYFTVTGRPVGGRS